jgi:hypothetical protein
MRILVSGSTTTVSEVAQRWPESLGILLAPRNRNSVASVVATGLPWAADNGAFSGFDAERFLALLARMAGQPGLLFVVAPDVVADAKATLALWPRWHKEIHRRGMPAAFVLQDGQEHRPLPRADAYFVGGSTRWKLSPEAAALVAKGKRRGAHIHMGRVNTLRRLEYAWAIGCDSVDGSCFSRWADKFLEWAIVRLKQRQRQPFLPSVFIR